MKKTAFLLVGIIGLAGTVNSLHAQSTKIEEAKRLVITSSQAAQKHVPNLALLSLGFFLVSRAEAKVKGISYADNYAFKQYMKGIIVPLVGFVATGK